VDEPEYPNANDPVRQPGSDAELPPGNHPLEVAARRGIGPLSPYVSEVWHGHARPCVTCGQLVQRDAAECDQCGQDLSSEMIEKMRAHAGPWYVLEHVRPFPGVSLERVIRQLHRGLITETSIIRGPSTDYQWRFAVETPGLCRYFGRCWSCHEEVSATDTYCRSCLSNLLFDQPRPAPAVPPSPKSLASTKPTESTALTGSKVPIADQSPERTERKAPERAAPEARSATPGKPDGARDASNKLEQLSAVVDRTDVPAHEPIWDEPPRIAGIRATWVAVVLLIVVIVVLLFVTQSRSGQTTPPPPATPGTILPVLN